MYYNIFCIFLIINTLSFSQIKVNNQSYLYNKIDNKQLSLLQYKVPLYHYTQFKTTCKIAANRNAVFQILQDQDAFDGIPMSQLGQYNLRIRWKFKNSNRIYAGTENFTIDNNINMFYVGFRKFF